MVHLLALGCPPVLLPQIMRLIFPTKPGIKYPWEDIFQTYNVRTVSWGTESLSHLGPKIWKTIPFALKSMDPDQRFTCLVLYSCPLRFKVKLSYPTFTL